MPTPYSYVPGVSEIYRFGRRHFRSLAYFGNNVFCGVCDGEFTKFLGSGDGVCPYCNSATRHRFLVSKLSELSLDGGKRKTLFFAPDWGVERWLKKSNNFAVTTADLFAPNVDLKLDITNIDLRDKSFDVILCSHVLEHVPDDFSAMKEMLRILSADGVLFLQVPIKWESEVTDEDFSVIDPKERQARFGQFDHVRLYGRDIITRLVSAGFEVTASRCKDKFDASQMARFGLWNDIIFVCRPLT